MPRQAKQIEPAIAPANSELSPLELTAIAKAPRNLDKLRPRLEVGDGQEVDVTVRIHGLLNVGGEATSTSTESAGADKVLAVVLSHVSARARKTLLDGVRADFDGYRDGGELPAIADDVVDLADDLITSASRQVNKPKKGAVSAALAIELIERG